MMSGMKRAIFGAVLAGAAVSVQAGDLTVDVVGSPAVSLSVNGSTPAATYTVTVTNTSTSGNASMKNVWFKAVANVVEGQPGAIAPYMTSSAPWTPLPETPCESGLAGANSVACTAPGPLARGESRTFTVTFTAPTSGTSLDLVWESGFNTDDGSGGNSGGAGDNGANRLTQLKKIDPNNVETDIPVGTDVIVFTGDGVAKPGDTWVTQVEVKGLATAALRAAVFENVTTGGLAPDLLTTSSSIITIPGASGLIITLRRDASTIGKNAKIANARIYYKADENQQGLGTEVFPCTSAGPQLGIPCIESRYEYPRKSTGKVKVTPGFEGDWEFVIRAIDNGKYEQ
jgi:hypothetical protein